MTEAEWLQFTDFGPVSDYLQSIASRRKARLYAVACCRSVERWLTEPCCWRAIESSEKLADELLPKQALAAARKNFPAAERFRFRAEASVRELSPAYGELSAASRPIVWSASWDACHWVLRADGWDAARACQLAAEVVHSKVPLKQENSALLRRLAHDIFSSAFRPVAFDPRWRTSDAVGLARGIYEERAFERMPLLADALMDAGCNSEPILEHCRSAGPHVRGCWVVDLVLGKG
jgi:hypothetical protein